MIAAVLFAFQIYGDFSGYSDIAIGAANVIGIKLMKTLTTRILHKTLWIFGADGTFHYPVGLWTMYIFRWADHAKVSCVRPLT